jgi:cysteine desulfurase
MCREAGALIHCDLTQAVGKMPIDLGELGVDAATLSGHKFGGLKGAGALLIDKRLRIDGITHGGGQEAGVRPGTENVIGIVAMARALDDVTRKLEARSSHLRQLSERTRAFATDCGWKLNGSWECTAPGIVSLSIEGADASTLLEMLPHIAIGTGSACNSELNFGSHVLRAMHASDETISGSIRLSFGTDTTMGALDRALEQIQTAASELRTRGERAALAWNVGR